MSSNKTNDPVNIGVQAKDSSAELGRVGRVMGALHEIGTPEALANRDKLSALLTAWQHIAQRLQKLKDEREAKARAAAMLKMLISVIDGFRALLGFLDPALSAEIP